MSKKIFLPLALVSFLLAVFSAWQMTALPLWGHRPLLLFGGLWASVLLVWRHRIHDRPEEVRLWNGAVLSGILLSFGFPPSPLFILLFVAWIPLLIVEEDIVKQEGKTLGKAFRYGFTTFLTWNILTTYWVTNTLFFAGVLALLPNTLLMCIPWVLFHLTHKKVGKKWGYISLLTYWMAFEYIHLNWEQMSWPWLTLGNGLATYPAIFQWYEYTGVFGGTLWILGLNVLIFRRIYGENALETERLVYKWSVPTLAFLLPLAFSIALYLMHEEQGELQEVVVVQPNYEPHFQKFEIPEAEQLNHFLFLAREQVTQETDYLVFPETSFERIWIDRIEESETIQKLKTFLAEFPNLTLVSGVASYKRYRDEEPSQPFTRTSERRNSTLRYDSYNAAIQLEDSTEFQHYIKSKLVPGAEFTPFGDYTTAFKELADKLGGSRGLGKQKERSVFKSKKGSGVAPVICYESIFGEYTTGYIKNGAEAIFIVTNDGWWDDTPGYKQHLYYASLRAVENRRSIARSANTGISAFINQRGDVSQATNYEEDAVIKAFIPFDDGQTVYTRYGDLLGRLAGLISILLLLTMLSKSRIKKE